MEDIYNIKNSLYKEFWKDYEKYKKKYQKNNENKKLVVVNETKLQANYLNQLNNDNLPTPINKNSLPNPKQQENIIHKHRDDIYQKNDFNYNLSYDNNILIKMAAKGKIIPFAFLEQKIENIEECIIKQNYIKEKLKEFDGNTDKLTVGIVVLFLVAALICSLKCFFI